MAGAEDRRIGNRLLGTLPPAELAVLAPALRRMEMPRGAILFESDELIGDI